MNAHLKAIYEKTIDIYRDDPRIIGAWEFGSLGKGTGDAYSDDDIAAALAQEIDVFAVDAREACRRWGMVYPHAIETDIRAYLTGQGFAVKLTAEG